MAVDNDRFTSECANEVLQSLDISQTIIDDCIQNSFEVENDYQSDNRILKED